MHIRKGDLIEVLNGDEAGKTGKVKTVLRNKGKVIIDGLNMVHKNLKPSQENPKGGRIQKEAPLAASNVLPVCSNKGCKGFGHGVRTRSSVLEDRRKIRVCVKCDNEIYTSE